MPDGRRSDLGVLFVHGVGEQKRGDTLIRCADPLEAWLRGRVSVAPERRALVDTELAPADGQPAHARLELALAEGGRLDWLMAESWWGETVRVPTPITVLRWVGLTGWRLVAQQIGRAVQVFWRDIRTIRDNWRLIAWSLVPVRAKWLPDLILGACTLIIGAIALPVIGLLGFGAFSFALLLALALVPLALLPPARPLIRRVQLAVANGIGDPRILESSAVAYDSMVTHVQRDLAWLEARCGNVAVVAHSQGSVIAYDALRERGVTGRVGLMVTYGSALRLAKREIWLPEVKWRDFYAGSDAVAGGPLWPRRTHWRRSEPVDNLGSVMSDHLRYWSNSEQFVSAVANELAALTPIHGSLAGDGDQLADARRDRRQRVTWLVVARTAFITAAAAVISLLGGDDLPSLGTAVANVLEDVLQVALRKSVGPDVEGGAVGWAVAALFVVAAAGLLYRALATSAWMWWSASETRALQRRQERSDRFARPAFALAGLGFPVVVVLAVRLAWGQQRVMLPLGLDPSWTWFVLGPVFVVAAGSLALGRRLSEPIPRALLDPAQVWEGGHYALVDWWTLKHFGCCKVTVTGFADKGRIHVRIDEGAPPHPRGRPPRFIEPEPFIVPVSSLYPLAEWERYRERVEAAARAFS